MKKKPQFKLQHANGAAADIEKPKALPNHLSVVNVHGVRLYLNHAYWESHRLLGIGGNGWQLKKSFENGFFLKAMPEVDLIGERYSASKMTVEGSRIKQLEDELQCLRNETRQTNELLEWRVQKAEKAMQKAAQKAEQRVQEAYAERDHAQAHVRKLCSELLRRDEYQHAKRYLKQQLRKLPQTPNTEH